jgi:hypothetical protein
VWSAGRIDEIEKRGTGMTSKTTITRAVCASTLAAGIGLTALFGVGLGTASAEPGPGCGRPGTSACDNRDDRDRGPGQVEWQGRGVDQGRQDHRPFNWNGQQVIPMRDGNGQGWGFWFLGTWIPL